MKNKFIYFPSVSAGAFGNTVHRLYGMEGKNGISTHGIDVKYWGDDYSEHKFPYMLVTAGHRLHISDIRDQFGFQEDTVLMGDSGGFQIATGAVKYNDNMKVKLLKWMEDNVNIGINLDIPPRLQYEGKFDYCLKESKANFKYFADNRSNKNTSLLNVLQGTGYESYNAWYNQVEQYKFDGWSVGGVGGNFTRLITSLYFLLYDKKIHEDESIKYLHYLGASKISELLILMYAQHKVQSLGSSLTITTDSSSPSLGAVFGRLNVDFSIKDMSFKAIKIPSYKLDKDVIEEMARLNLKLPYSSGYNKFINPNFSYQDMIDCYVKDDLYVQEMNAILILHNIGVYVESVEKLRSVIEAGAYVWEQLLPKYILDTFKMVDDIFNGMKYDSLIAKYHNVIKQNDSKQEQATENNFWD